MPNYGRNVHVSCEWQFVKCQVALGLYSPSGPYAVKDERFWNWRLLEALRSTPFRECKKKGIFKKGKENVW
jgi:hypothetical protein